MIMYPVLYPCTLLCCSNVPFCTLLLLCITMYNVHCNCTYYYVTCCTVPKCIIPHVHRLLLNVQVEWEEVEPEEDDATLRNPSVSQYFVKVGKPTRGKPSRIHPYFKERCLAPLTTL